MINLEKLNEKEIREINGGESGWYYIAYAAGAVDKWLGDALFTSDYWDSSWEQYQSRN